MYTKYSYSYNNYMEHKVFLHHKLCLKDANCHTLNKISLSIHTQRNLQKLKNNLDMMV